MKPSLLCPCFCIFALIAAHATALLGQDALGIAEAKIVAEVKDRLPVGPNLSRAEGRPQLFCWMRVKGNAAILEQAAATGNASKIFHQWVWVSGTQRISLDRIPLKIPELEDLEALKREVAQRGFFDFKTWSYKKNLRHGNWLVKVLDAKGQPFKDENGEPLLWEFYID